MPVTIPRIAVTMTISARLFPVDVPIRAIRSMAIRHYQNLCRRRSRPGLRDLLGISRGFGGFSAIEMTSERFSDTWGRARDTAAGETPVGRLEGGTQQTHVPIDQRVAEKQGNERTKDEIGTEGYVVLSFHQSQDDQGHANQGAG